MIAVQGEFRSRAKIRAETSIFAPAIHPTDDYS
jgi:hypothetical protein